MTSLNQTVRVSADGSIERGIEVPHEGANVPCYQQVGTRKDAESGIVYTLHCKRRAGHDVPKGEQPHVPVDWRVVAAPPRKVHTTRFAPNSIPKGVDQGITLPHDCDNHLDVTNEVLRRGW